MVAHTTWRARQMLTNEIWCEAGTPVECFAGLQRLGAIVAQTGNDATWFTVAVKLPSGERHAYCIERVPT